MSDWKTRIEKRVEAHGGGSGQRDLLREYVVRLYDRGPADSPHEQPERMYCSREAHGTQGVFDDATEAEAFASEVKEAYIAAGGLADKVEVIRRGRLPERLEEQEEIEDEAKGRASEANAEAKAARLMRTKLRQEAQHPRLRVECTPGVQGWAVHLEPSETDGEARRLMVVRGSEPAPETSSVLIDELLAEAAGEPEKDEPKPTKKGAKPRKMPNTVKGSRGRVGPGMVVVFGGSLAMVDRIEQDDAGTYWLIIYYASGNEDRARADRCRKATKAERRAAGWEE